MINRSRIQNYKIAVKRASQLFSLENKQYFAKNWKNFRQKSSKKFCGSRSPKANIIQNGQLFMSPPTPIELRIERNSESPSSK